MIQHHIQTEDQSTRSILENGYREVVCQFSFPSDFRLLCFMDNEDFDGLGPTNRGFHVSLNDYFALPAVNRLVPLPTNVLKCLAFDRRGNPNFENLVYLQGSTTGNHPAFIMSLAHELQHAWQYLYHGDSLRSCMEMSRERSMLGAGYINDPSEKEAMLVSRRVAVSICGRDAIEDYIRIHLCSEPPESVRWDFLNDWNAVLEDLPTETGAALKKHRESFPNSRL